MAKMPENIYNGTGNYEASPVSTGKSEYEDVSTIARIGSAEMNLVAKFQTFFQEVMENFYRLAGHIYSSNDLRKLMQEKRPNFEWNLFLPIILSVVGNFKNAIPSVDFYAEGDSVENEQAANLQKKLSDYFLFQANDIEYELSKAFLYSVVARIGWLKTSYSYRKDADGMILLEWYDSLRLKFDTNWRRRDTSDMRYMSDSGWYEASEIIDIYAKKDKVLRDEIYDKALLIVGESAMKKGKMKKLLLTWAERFLNDSIDYQGRKHGYNTFNGNNLVYNYAGTWYNSDGRFKVVDWYERRSQPEMKITDMVTGKSEIITDLVKKQNPNLFDSRDWYDNEKLQQIRAQYTRPKITQSWNDIIWQTSVVPALNLKLYDAPQKFQNKQFKFIPILCYDFHPNILETRSVMDNIIDPISSYNLRRNTILTYIMKMTQGGYLAEESAVKGFEDELANNEIGSVTKIANGAISGNRIQKKDPPLFPQALAAEAQMEKEDTQIISGQTPNVRGMKESSKETGVLFEQRVQQSNILQEWIADNAQFAVVMAARNNLSLAQKYLVMPRILMILGTQDNPQWIKINLRILGKVTNDVSFGKYTLRIAKQPYGKKSTDLEFRKVMEINAWLESLDKAYVDPKIALKLSNLSVKNEMINFIEKAQAQIAQQAQAQMQAQQEAQDQQMQLQNKQIQLDSNQKKINLLNSMNEIHKKTLENRNLANEIVTKQIMNKLLSPSRAS